MNTQGLSRPPALACNQQPDHRYQDRAFRSSGPCARSRGYASVARKPSKGPFHDPTFRKIINQSGKHAEVVALNAPGYQQALSQKLVEEAQEAAMASEGELVTELADRPEVMEALMSTSGSSLEMVRQVQAKRRAERGGFTQRLLLLWTEDGPATR